MEPAAFFVVETKMLEFFLLLLLVSVADFSQGKHRLRFTTFCRSNVSGDGGYDIEFDGDELLYSDPYPQYLPHQRLEEFSEQWTPDPALRQDAYISLGTCYYNMPRAIKGEDSPKETITTPTAMIYLEEEIELGILNTLICFLNNLHPPLVNITWTRNGQLVDLWAVSQTQYYSNEDFSFYTLSYLQFIPQEGDIYACSVEHAGLQSPLARFLEVKGTDQQLAETALCVSGAILGLIGLATGLWFIVKANKSCRAHVRSRT